MSTNVIESNGTATKVTKPREPRPKVFETFINGQLTPAQTHRALEEFWQREYGSGIELRSVKIIDGGANFRAVPVMVTK